MSNEINEYIIRFTGSGSIPEPIKTDNDYRVGLDVSVTSAEKRSRQDGTYDIIFKCKIISGEVLQDNGETMIMKDKGRHSQNLRKAIYSSGWDYDDMMPRIIARVDDIADLIYNN